MEAVKNKRWKSETQQYTFNVLHHSSSTYVLTQVSLNFNNTLNVRSFINIIIIKCTYCTDVWKTGSNINLMNLNILYIVLVIRKSTTVFFRSLYGTRRNQENLSYYFLLSLAKASIKAEEVAILSVLADCVEWGGAQSTHRVATAAFWRKFHHDGKIHRVAMADFWCTFHHDGKISPCWWGWGVHAQPLTLFYYHVQSCSCSVRSSCREGRYAHSISSLHLCTLWSGRSKF